TEYRGARDAGDALAGRIDVEHDERLAVIDRPVDRHTVVHAAEHRAIARFLGGYDALAAQEAPPQTEGDQRRNEQDGGEDEQRVALLAQEGFEVVDRDRCDVLQRGGGEHLLQAVKVVPGQPRERQQGHEQERDGEEGARAEAFHGRLPSAAVTVEWVGMSPRVSALPGCSAAGMTFVASGGREGW